MAQVAAERQVNVVDPERGVMQQHRTALLRVPRSDGGVDLLLAKTVRTVRLPMLQQSGVRGGNHRRYGERTPLMSRARDEEHEDSRGDDDDNVSCFSWISLLCTACCLFGCLPCNDRACFSLWQVITWFGLLSLIPLTAFGSFSCEPLHSTSIIVIVMLVFVALLSATCFLYHCWSCERCFLSCCGCLFIMIFITTIIAGSYFIFHVPGTYDTIIHGKYPNATTNGTEPVSFIHCHFTGTPLVAIVSGYLAVVIYLILCMGCCYHCFRNME